MLADAVDFHITRAGGTLQSFGGFLRCEGCGNRKQLGDVGRKLRDGWPRCCGYTMRWWTQRQIDAGEVPAIEAVSGD
jgi:hypothetical protein